jgi:hypothetical protein
MMRAVALLLLAVLSIGITTAGQPRHAVRDEAQAIKIAIAAWQPIYGGRTSQPRSPIMPA